MKLRVAAPPEHRRADIDGLRAIAVLAVLGFHAFPALLPGGFIGVDVFFVISGYLISGILFADIEARTFRLRDFYARRIRRIFPALVLVLAATLAAGYATLFADELAALSRQVIAGCAFASNFLLWQEAGYFDRASELKPLLHLWSLAIEEQFYLLWPALLWLARGRRGWGALIGVSVSASLAASVLLSGPSPTAGFYSPGTRFWELGVGALLAWLALDPRRGVPGSGASGVPDGPARPAADALSVLGLALVLGSTRLIDRHDVFPGALALVPTLGGAALIAAGPRALVNRALLSRPLAVGIGALSYPLYLWHWPLLAYARILTAGEPAVAVRVGILGASLLLAWLTYGLLETPVRRRPPLAAAARAALLAMVAVGALAGLAGARALGPDADARAVHGRGDAGTLAKENRRQLGWFAPDPACVAELGLGAAAAVAKEALFCSVSAGPGPVAVALLGDSTANHLYPGLARLYATRGERLLNAGNGTCAPFHGLAGHFEWNRPCAAVNRTLYAYVLARPAIRTVILSMTPWDLKNMDVAGLAPGGDVAARFAAVAPWVRADLAALTRAGKRVIVTFDTPLIGLDPAGCAASAVRCTVPVATMDARMEPYRSEWHRLLDAAPGVCVFSQDALFRLADGRYTAARNGVLLYRDDHHLSYAGSELVAAALRDSPCY